MPTVDSEVLIHAPLESVYALARDIERFPQFMEDVEEVTILEQTPERQVSRWVGVIKELRRTIAWTEEDFWNDQEHVCVFRQTEGDFTDYGGRWEFVPEGEGTRVRLRLDYEYHVPLVGALIQNLLKKKMQANTDAMLAALKREAEQGNG
jgi:ribosome-associated toxin RatA of RatAB toxin-antitoxin module